MTVTVKGTVWNAPGVTLQAAGCSRLEVVCFQFDSRIWTLYECNSPTKPIAKMYSLVSVLVCILMYIPHVTACMRPCAPDQRDPA